MINVTHIQAGFASVTDENGTQVGSIQRVSNRQWAVVSMTGRILTEQHSLYACETWCARRPHKLGVNDSALSRSSRSQSCAINACGTKTDLAALGFTNPEVNLFNKAAVLNCVCCIVAILGFALVASSL